MRSPEDGGFNVGVEVDPFWLGILFWVVLALIGIVRSFFKSDVTFDETTYNNHHLLPQPSFEDELLNGLKDTDLTSDELSEEIKEQINEEELKLHPETERLHRAFMKEINENLTLDQKNNILLNIYSIYNKLTILDGFLRLKQVDQFVILRKFFIKNMYSIDGNPVPFNVGVTASKLEMEALYSESDEAIDAYLTYLEENNIEAALPKGLEAPNTYDFDMTDIVRQLYYDIFRNWGVEATSYYSWSVDFVEKFILSEYYSKRDENGKSLISFGQSLKESKDYDVIFTNPHPEIIFPILKGLLSDLEKDSIGLLGVRDVYEIQEIYVDVICVLLFSKHVKEAIDLFLEEGLIYNKPYLVKLHERIHQPIFLYHDGEVISSTNRLGEFAKIFAQVKVELKLNRSETHGYADLIKSIESNSYTKKMNLVQKSIDRMINGSITHKPALFFKKNINGDVVTHLNHEIANNVQIAYDKLVNKLSTSSRFSTNLVHDFSELLKLIGFFDSNEDTDEWIKSYLTKGIYERSSGQFVTKLKAMNELLSDKHGLGLFISKFYDEDGKLKNKTEDTPDKYKALIGRFAHIQISY
jgi:hypothetical protein